MPISSHGLPPYGRCPGLYLHGGLLPHFSQSGRESACRPLSRPAAMTCCLLRKVNFRTEERQHGGRRRHGARHPGRHRWVNLPPPSDAWRQGQRCIVGVAVKADEPELPRAKAHHLGVVQARPLPVRAQGEFFPGVFLRDLGADIESAVGLRL
jgi:hypothetical protein